VDDPLSGQILGHKLPIYVAAIEKSKAGTRFHGFLQIGQRDTWIKEDPEHREAIYARSPRVIAAWTAFSIVLHPDPRLQRRMWDAEIREFRSPV
jgi:hypothetical protein